MTRAIMVQGTTSDAGKSTLVAGLCRVLRDRGHMVAPFKPQNMALNSAVTADGGEIGRAQAVQAQACGLAPHTDMNPVLIKPSSDTGAQIIIQGQAQAQMNAQGFHQFKPKAQAAVLASFERLQARYQSVVVEGAGSPAEINLREGDIANMGFAEAVNCPVILVADIDKGGVFAHLVGTLDLLSASEQNRVVGFVINKFRGDKTLLDPGLAWLEQRTGKPVFGVLPYLHDFYLEAEDAIDASQTKDDNTPLLNIVVPVFPRISNHTDVDALRHHPRVNLHFVGPGQTPPPADMVILPGSKSVMDDLAWLRENGWQNYLDKHLRYGGKVMGICGGLQMLGESIVDNEAVESTHKTIKGLGYLPLHTVFKPEKQLANKRGILRLGNSEAPVEGYEIHHGDSTVDNHAVDNNTTQNSETQRLLHYDDGSTDGYLSNDQQIFGCYLHGLFDTPATCDAILQWAGLAGHNAIDMRAFKEKNIVRLAESVASHLDIAAIENALCSWADTGKNTSGETQKAPTP